MASHVVVIDTTFRRATIKVNPGTFISDVLDEACIKLNLKASNYGLKHNSKPVDLSRTIRQAGLSAGAKLELVVASRSPSVVSVALQIPETEAANIPGGRLIQKFPSTTTLWLILRAFESSEGRTLNFTGRGVAKTHSDSAGAGRIMYESPVLNIMGRELSTFGDFQKSLAQFGLNSGSSLIRLGFRTTDKPLDQAMVEIADYFKSDEGLERVDGSSTVDNKDTPVVDRGEDTARGKVDEASSMDVDPELPAIVPTTSQTLSTNSSLKSESLPTVSAVIAPDSREISIFAAPSSDIPSAATYTHNDADYEPTVAHAKMHQTLLQSRTQNQRLPSYAAAQALADEKAAKQAAVKEVSIKIRFPDQLTVVAMFGREDTGSDLYKFVRGVIIAEKDPFALVWTSSKGSQTVPQDTSTFLIKDLGFSGRMLVTFNWQDGASDQARKTSALKSQFASQAKDLKIPEVAATDAQENTNASPLSSQAAAQGETSGGKGKGGIPKWLKLPGKK